MRHRPYRQFVLVTQVVPTAPPMPFPADESDALWHGELESPTMPNFKCATYGSKKECRYDTA